MPDSQPHTRGPDPFKLSMWTVFGAVAASVVTAGILGGASGILQIPTMQSEIVSYRAWRDDVGKTIGQIEGRTRSSELVAESAQRQLGDIRVRLDALVARLDIKDREDRNADIQTQRDIAALEGRSKDRHTEANGVINGLKSELSGLVDRQKQNAEAVNDIRQHVYDLATRIYRQGNQQSLPILPSPGTGSFSSPSPSSNKDQLYSDAHGEKTQPQYDTER